MSKKKKEIKEEKNPELEKEAFYLSKKTKVKGTRSMVRGKVLEVLFAHEVSGEDIEELFQHIFFRIFKFESEEPKEHKLLTREEIYELEADIPIEWDEEDIEFARELIKHTLRTKTFAIESIKRTIENWEFDRITMIDRIILEMAIAELLNFPDISPKITINEAIEVAKQYSTDKSGIFVNGLLDTLLKRFIKEGLISKKEN
jgi:transcription antitermination factor NusB